MSKDPSEELSEELSEEMSIKFSKEYPFEYNGLCTCFCIFYGSLVYSSSFFFNREVETLILCTTGGIITAGLFFSYQLFIIILGIKLKTSTSVINILIINYVYTY